eukprot:6210940-Pleurochrysis_carterae.AAC.1
MTEAEAASKVNAEPVFTERSARGEWAQKNSATCWLNCGSQKSCAWGAERGGGAIESEGVHNHIIAGQPLLCGIHDDAAPPHLPFRPPVFRARACICSCTHGPIPGLPREKRGAARAIRVTMNSGAQLRERAQLESAVPVPGSEAQFKCAVQVSDSSVRFKCAVQVCG